MKCLICENKAVARGLCHNCYQAATRDIKKGKQTWEKLEGYKIALPLKHKQKSEFRKAMDEIKQNSSTCYYAPPTNNFQYKPTDLPGQRLLLVDGLASPDLPTLSGS